MSFFFKSPFFILFLIIHSHLPVFNSHTTKTHNQGFLYFFSFLHITYTFQKKTLLYSHRPLYVFLLLHFSILSFKPLSSSFVSFFFFSFCSPSPLKGTWIDQVAAAFLTGLRGLIFYLEQGPQLHYTSIYRLTPNCVNHVCITSVSLKINIHRTHAGLPPLLSPHRCRVCTKCHARPQRESNH